MTLGKAVRLHRIFSHPSGCLFSVAIDHFVGYANTMTDGLANLPRTIAQIVAGKPDAVTMYEGTATHCWPPYAGELALIIQMACSTVDDRIMETLGSVLGAIHLGADAVALGINVRGKNEGYSLRTLSNTVTEAEPFGLPVIAHIYPRATDGTQKVLADADNVAWAVRCGIECGADIIKVPYPGEPAAFREIVLACPVPIVAAGGPKTDTFEEALSQAADAIGSGASGITVGRNVWASDRDTVAAITAYKLIVHDGTRPEEALEMVRTSQRD